MASSSTVLIAGDHRGYKLKAGLIGWLQQQGHTAMDLGTNSEDRCDASDFAKKLAEAIKADKALRGVLICGSGHAMVMTANRYRDIRAALCLKPELARLAREHNDANVLVLAADFMDEATAQQCLEVFLATPHAGGRYAERRDKLTDMGGL